MSNFSDSVAPIRLTQIDNASSWVIFVLTQANQNEFYNHAIGEGDSNICSLSEAFLSSIKDNQERKAMDGMKKQKWVPKCPTDSSLESN